MDASLCQETQKRRERGKEEESERGERECEDTTTNKKDIAVLFLLVLPAEHNVEQAHQLHIVVGPMVHQEFEACFLETAIRFVRRISFLEVRNFEEAEYERICRLVLYLRDLVAHD